ncbi:MAG: helix-hairpin-helix domain-containing protein, partial [Gemmatimonadales bacterium]|nr:helix-hairpin-helix domain-containing protein [Gemmatimonadales bacterium]
MTVMDRTEVAAALERIASYLELRGENPFRVRAFRTATRTVEGLSGDLAAAIADGTLAEAKGIGPAILEVITELASTGRSELFESLRHEVPPGLVEMLGIPGLGVARIRQIHTTLGLETLPELEAAARDGRLALLPRFGERTAQNILKGIAFLRQASQWRLCHHAREEAEALVAALGTVPHVIQAHAAGEVRRRTEVV